MTATDDGGARLLNIFEQLRDLQAQELVLTTEAVEEIKRQLGKNGGSPAGQVVSLHAKRSPRRQA